MTNMYCPMAFNNHVNQYEDDGITKYRHSLMECTPDCAWSAWFDGLYGCAVSVGIAKGAPNIAVNARPLKDDTE